MKNLWKFWNGLLCRNKSGPSPLLNVAAYWKTSNTEACAKKLSQILVGNIDNRGRVVGVRICVRYCLEKKMKNETGGWKSQTFLLLKLTIFCVWGMLQRFVTNYFTAWRLWSSKYVTVKINESYNGFLLLKENILIIQSVLAFLLKKHKNVSLLFL